MWLGGVMYTCVYVYYIYLCIYTHTHACNHVSSRSYSICMSTNVCVLLGGTCMNVYVCTYVYIIYIYIYTYTYLSFAQTWSFR